MPNLPAPAVSFFTFVTLARVRPLILLLLSGGRSSFLSRGLAFAEVALGALISLLFIRLRFPRLLALPLLGWLLGLGRLNDRVLLVVDLAGFVLLSGLALLGLLGLSWLNDLVLLGVNLAGLVLLSGLALLGLLDRFLDLSRSSCLDGLLFCLDTGLAGLAWGQLGRPEALLLRLGVANIRLVARSRREHDLQAGALAVGLAESEGDKGTLLVDPAHLVTDDASHCDDLAHR